MFRMHLQRSVIRKLLRRAPAVRPRVQGSSFLAHDVFLAKVVKYFWSLAAPFRGRAYERWRGMGDRSVAVTDGWALREQVWAASEVHGRNMFGKAHREHLHCIEYAML